MLISVVTAVFNRRQVIASAIETLQAQSYATFEHVVQDGGSTDGTLDVVAQLADTRTRLESQPDAGIYDALNRGISRATGDIVGLLHSDDQFAHADVLKDIAQAMQDPEIDGVYGDLVYVDRNNPDRVVRYWKAGEYSRDKLRRGWMPPHPTLYLRANVFERFGAYDASMQISADYEAMVRWLYGANIRVKYIPEVLVKMRTGGASNKSLRHIYQKSREDLEAIRRHQIGGLGTLVAKNVRKLNQFTTKPSPQ